LKDNTLQVAQVTKAQLGTITHFFISHVAAFVLALIGCILSFFSSTFAARILAGLAIGSTLTPLIVDAIYIFPKGGSFNLKNLGWVIFVAAFAMVPLFVFICSSFAPQQFQAPPETGEEKLGPPAYEAPPPYVKTYEI
jgi:hypothetical protein